MRFGVATLPEGWRRPSLCDSTATGLKRTRKTGLPLVHLDLHLLLDAAD
jgi:hypothetical protein